MSKNAYYLFKQKRFWPFFWTMFLGAFNDNIFKNALVMLITFKSFQLGPLEAKEMVALCGGIFILPFFLFSGTAGQIADRYSKSTLIFYIKIWEVFAMIIGAAGFYFQSIPLLLFTLFFMGTQSAFFGPAKYSVLPEVLKHDEILGANAYFSTGTFISILLGTILGGVIIQFSGDSSFYISLTVLLLAFSGVMVAKHIVPLAPANKDIKIQWDFIRPSWQILKMTFEKKSVFISVLGISWFWFMGAAVLSILPVFTKSYLHGDEGVATFFLALFSIGVGVGAILCEKISDKEVDLGLVIIGAIGLGLFLLDLTYVSPLQSPPEQAIVADLFQSFNGLRIVIDLFLFSLCGGLFSIPLITYIQVNTILGKRSQIVAGNNILNALMMVLASMLLIVLYAFKLDFSQIFLILSVLNLIVAYTAYKIVPEYFLRIACSLLAHILYRLKIQGREHIPYQGAALIVANHVTFIDWLFLCATSHRPMRFVMHKDFLKIPLASWFFKGSKLIPIASKFECSKTLDAAFNRIQEELQQGQVVCLFPEGSISTDGKMAKLKSGIEKILEKNPVPVIPIHIDGLWGSFWSKHPLSKRFNTLLSLRRKVTLKIGPIIRPERIITIEDLDQAFNKLNT